MIAISSTGWIWIFTVGSGVGLLFGGLVVMNSVRDRQAAKQDGADRAAMIKVSQQEIQTEGVRGTAQLVHFLTGLFALIGAFLTLLLPAFSLSSWILAAGSVYVWWTRWGHRHWTERLHRWRSHDS